MWNQKMKLLLLICILGACLLPPSLSSQTKYQLTKDSKISIVGTSTLHDWLMSSNQMKSAADFTIDKDGHFEKLHSLNFSIQVNTLKSDNAKLDRNAYDALKISQHPEIRFQSQSAEIRQIQGRKHHLKVKGKLTIAGVTKERVIEATCEVDANRNFVCTGQTTLKMTEFNVTPPSFMFGAMKTGDEITINYSINYKN